MSDDKLLDESLPELLEIYENGINAGNEWAEEAHAAILALFAAERKLTDELVEAVKQSEAMNMGALHLTTGPAYCQCDIHRIHGRINAIKKAREK